MASLLITKAVEHVIGADSYKFRLPLPPSANKITAHAYGRQATYRHPVYQAWIDECLLIVPRIKKKPNHRHWDLDIKMFIYYVHKFNTLDADNCIKPLVDLVKTAIEIDDRYNLKGSWERVNVKSDKQRKDHYCDCVVTIY